MKEKDFFTRIFCLQVTRSSSYTRKSQFQVEEEDIEKLEIRYVAWSSTQFLFSVPNIILNLTGKGEPFLIEFSFVGSWLMKLRGTCI